MGPHLDPLPLELMGLLVPLLRRDLWKRGLCLSVLQHGAGQVGQLPSESDFLLCPISIVGEGPAPWCEAKLCTVRSRSLHPCPSFSAVFVKWSWEQRAPTHGMCPCGQECWMETSHPSWAPPAHGCASTVTRCSPVPQLLDFSGYFQQNPLCQLWH